MRPSRVAKRLSALRPGCPLRRGASKEGRLRFAESLSGFYRLICHNAAYHGPACDGHFDCPDGDMHSRLTLDASNIPKQIMLEDEANREASIMTDTDKIVAAIFVSAMVS